MHFSLIAVFPELYQSFVSTGLLAKGQQKGLFSIDLISYFSYVTPKERIDSPTCGPGPGMLIRPDLVEKILEDNDAKKGRSFKIFFSPQGKKLDQNVLKDVYAKMSGYDHCTLISARYEGMDERVEAEYADEIISVGDFVLMSGDLPALIFLESYVRLIPGVIGNTESVARESFQGPFIDYPEYTQPVEWKGRHVPPILLSGHHAEIERWRREQAVKKTVKHHFQWLKRSAGLTVADKKQAFSCIPPHYAALLHSGVLVGSLKAPGNTSVTSLDMHDIARSARTYGLKNFFIVTPLQDQQALVATLLDFWKNGIGCDYNPSRHEAVKRVEQASTLDDVCNTIARIEGGEQPVVLATSAKECDHDKKISFYDQEKVWSLGRPVLFIFGTGQGLAPDTIERSDFFLPPLQGFSDFNHLSVRTAAGIVFDRWLGNNEKFCL